MAFRRLSPQSRKRLIVSFAALFVLLFAGRSILSTQRPRGRSAAVRVASLRPGMSDAKVVSVLHFGEYERFAISTESSDGNVTEVSTDALSPNEYVELTWKRDKSGLVLRTAKLMSGRPENQDITLINYARIGPFEIAL